MIKYSSILCILTAVLLTGSLIGQDNRKMVFPDIEGYVTLKTDFHIHTVFSDGSVWPDIRIDEAVRDGLDAISLTEHIEYLPHEEDIPHPDRNRSYLIAKELAKPHDLIIVHGTEITRDLPPGHANALFIQDANKIKLADPIEAYRAARKQGAFIFWNHPNWINQKEDGHVELTSMHRQLIQEDLLHGIEVVNDLTYSDDAFEVALKEGLTVMGTSDIHGLVDWQYRLSSGGHRPISLVFAKERSVDGIKEALFAGRTVTWFENILAGDESNLQALLDASLMIKEASYIGPSSVAQVILQNQSHASYILKNTSQYDFQSSADIIEIGPHESVKILVMTNKQEASFDMTFEVLNAMIGRRRHATLSLSVEVDN